LGLGKCTCLREQPLQSQVVHPLDRPIQRHPFKPERFGRIVLRIPGVGCDCQDPQIQMQVSRMVPASGNGVDIDIDQPARCPAVTAGLLARFPQSRLYQVAAVVRLEVSTRLQPAIEPRVMHESGEAKSRVENSSTGGEVRRVGMA